MLPFPVYKCFFSYVSEEISAIEKHIHALRAKRLYTLLEEKIEEMKENSKGSIPYFFIEIMDKDVSILPPPPKPLPHIHFVVRKSSDARLCSKHKATSKRKEKSSIWLG